MRQPWRNAGSLLVVAGLLAACASPDGGAATKPAAAPDTELTITVAATPATKAQTWTLSCQPTGGTLPTSTDACAFVAKTQADAVAPVPGNVACTLIFGGPQRATIKGTWRGQAVNASFNRTNGCEVARWNRLTPLLGDAA